MSGRPLVAVLGASGLIGCALAEDLAAHGYPVRAVARRFTVAQRASFGADGIEAPFGRFEPARLAEALGGAEVIINCVGVLQDGPRGGTTDAHAGFVARLVEALQKRPQAPLLVHFSVPGSPAGDTTRFSRSKREGERIIGESRLPHAILRPGFVIAETAYGGGALVRALAALPVDLDAATAGRSFAAVAMTDVCAAVRRAIELAPPLGVTWDVMERRPGRVGDVIDAFRARFGGPRVALRLPGWLLGLGALAGDAAGWLGWSAPVRSTALAELRRGVGGDPRLWIAAMRFEPASCAAALAALPASVQEAWFARLYLAKPVVIAALVAFWILSGAVALGPGFAAASAFLVAHGFAAPLAPAITAATALADIAVGAAIAIRPTCRAGLLAGIALTLAYVAAVTLVAPRLWADPLGPLVKDLPALVLMVVALAIQRDR